MVPSGIVLRGGLSSPERDPTYAPDRVRYMTELGRVAAQHGEAMAESELAEALRKARLHGDEKSMGGALAALLWMGQGSPASMTQITRTALGRTSLQPRVGGCRRSAAWPSTSWAGLRTRRRRSAFPDRDRRGTGRVVYTRHLRVRR